MTLNAALAQLKALGNEKTRAHNTKYGAGDNQFRVNMATSEFSRRRWVPTANRLFQWTMNSTLAAVGIHFPKLRKRAITIGERLGVYRDYPAASPRAPVAVLRQ